MTHQQFPSSPVGTLNPLSSVDPITNPFFNPKTGHLAHTAPNSPFRLSPINSTTPTNMKEINPSNKVRLSMPPRAQTEAYDGERYEQESLFSNRIHTDPGDIDDAAPSQFHISRKQLYDDMKRKTSLQNLQSLIDDIKKANNKSYNAQKSTKSPKSESQPPVKWPKDISDISDNGEKKTYRSRKRPLSTNERVNESVGDSVSKSEKKAPQSPIQDIDEIEDLGIDERFVTESETPDELFEQMMINEREIQSCKNSREAGPLRYSKMSEEDAASIFEKRRKQLLSFLFKLGANSAVVKKKLFTKKPLMPKQANFSNKDLKYQSLLDKDMRSIKDTLRPSASPNTFIIYNNASEGAWSGVNQARVGTPARENNKFKRPPSSIKAGSDSASDAKRRNSLKQSKDKDDNNVVVRRNLESSFNKIAQDWQEGGDGKGFRKVKARAETHTGSVDEKRDMFENIKIDLKKVVAKKKKKKRAGLPQVPVQIQVPGLEPEQNVVENVAQKRTSEDLGLLSKNREVNETKEEKRVNMELIKHMRKKNKAVLSDIEEIDVQIQKMEAERQLREKRRNIEHSREVRGRKGEKRGKEEVRRTEVVQESIHEGYARNARARRSKERPKSMGFKTSFLEAMKQRKNPWEDNSQIASIQAKDSSQTASKGKREYEEGLFNSHQRDGNKKTKSRLTSDSERKTNNERWPRSPQHFHDRTTNDWNLEIDDRKRERTSLQKSYIKEIPISKAVPLLSNQTTSPQRSKRNMEDISIDYSKGANQEFNLKTAQSATHKRSDRESWSFGSPKTSLKQPTKKTGKEETEKEHRKGQSTASTLHSSRNTGNSNLGTNDDLFSLSISQNTSEKAKTKLNDNNKANNTSKQGQKHPPPNKNRKSLAENYNSTDLFGAALNSKPAKKQSIKISFFDEVKKILKEGCPDDQRTPASSLKDTSKNTIKSGKEEAQTGKREVINRPKTDSVSSMDIRTRLLKEGRPLEELKKSSKFLNAPGINNAKSRKELSKKPSLESQPPKSQNNLNRKPSETTSQGFETAPVPSSLKGYVNTLLDGDTERTEHLLTTERNVMDSSLSVAASEKIDRKQSETVQSNKSLKDVQARKQSTKHMSTDFQSLNKKKV